MLFLRELLDQNNLILEIKKNVLVYLSPFVKFAKEENLMINFTFLPFLTLKELMIQFKYIIYSQILIILVFVVNILSSLQIYTIFWNLVQKLMVNLQNNFQYIVFFFFFFLQGCTLITIFFNIFINNILDKCKRYGVITERKGVMVAYLLIILFCWPVLNLLLKTF
jgi:hypothetical protein